MNRPLHRPPVIVFGSALTSPSPRDVDVAVMRPWDLVGLVEAGAVRDHAEGAVRQWIVSGRAAASRAGCPGDTRWLPGALRPLDAAGVRPADTRAPLPVDAHGLIRSVYRWEKPDGTVVADPGPLGGGLRAVLDHYEATLPAPCGKAGYTELIEAGDAPLEIVWRRYDTIPAVLRTFGGDVEVCVAAWRALPAHARMIDIGTAEEAGDSDEGDWSGYVTGLMALRSAVRHAPAWRAIFARLPEGPFLAALLDRGPSDAGLDVARRGSAGNGARLFFGLRPGHGVHTEYGPVPWSRLERRRLARHGRGRRASAAVPRVGWTMWQAQSLFCAATAS